MNTYEGEGGGKETKENARRAREDYFGSARHPSIEALFLARFFVVLHATASNYARLVFAHDREECDMRTRKGRTCRSLPRAFLIAHIAGRDTVSPRLIVR